MCSNCRLRKRIKIPIYNKIEEMRCPKCGLKELHHPKYFFTDQFYYTNIEPLYKVNAETK